MGEITEVVKGLASRYLRSLLERPDVTVEPVHTGAYFDDYFIGQEGEEDEEFSNILVVVQVSNGGHETEIRKVEFKARPTGEEERVASKHISAIALRQHSAQKIRFRFVFPCHLNEREILGELSLIDTGNRVYRCPIRIFSGIPPADAANYS